MKKKLKQKKRQFLITTRYLKGEKHYLQKTNLNDENIKNRKENKYTTEQD